MTPIFQTLFSWVQFKKNSDHKLQNSKRIQQPTVAEI